MQYEMRACECGRHVFGTDKNTGIGYCIYHQSKRTDRKPKKPSFKAIKPKMAQYPDFGFACQPDLFMWLWEEAKDEKGIVTCPYTGERLNKFYNTRMWFSCFAHVLPKKSYTYWKLNPKNIQVVYPLFHTYIDQGTSLKRINHPDWKWELWDQRVEEMKLAYKQFKLDNLLA